MDKLIAEVQHLTGIKLTPRQVSSFEIYEQELLQWNEKFNLTAIRDPEGVRTKHFLDSLTCLVEMSNNPPQRLIDIGTGAGFPGIPLKIVLPAMQLTLVESIGKKPNFAATSWSFLILTMSKCSQKEPKKLVICLPIANPMIGR